MKLKLAYFGTPDFSAHFLEKLLNDKDLPIEIVLVVTQPDKPVGRKQIKTPSPVKQVALKYKLPIIDSLVRGQDPLAQIDLALLYAYGEIIPSDLLRAPKHGFWNIHPSLLPKYRGASPISYPLFLGDIETGVTLIQMDEELDHGPIIAQEKYEILPSDKRTDLETKLTDLGYELFHSVILASEARPGSPQNLQGDSGQARMTNVTLAPQNHVHATYTRRLTKKDGYIPLPILKKALAGHPLAQDELPSLVIDYIKHNHLEQLGQLEIENSSKIINDYFRGLYPWPGIWTTVVINNAEKRLKIIEMSLEMLHDSSLKLHINRVQLEGKNEVSFEEFNKAYRTSD